MFTSSMHALIFKPRSLICLYDSSRAAPFALASSPQFPTYCLVLLDKLIKPLSLPNMLKIAFERISPSPCRPFTHPSSLSKSLIFNEPPKFTSKALIASFAQFLNGVSDSSSERFSRSVGWNNLCSTAFQYAARAKCKSFLRCLTPPPEAQMPLAPSYISGKTLFPLYVEYSRIQSGKLVKVLLSARRLGMSAVRTVSLRGSADVQARNKQTPQEATVQKEVFICSLRFVCN